MKSQYLLLFCTTICILVFAAILTACNILMKKSEKSEVLCFNDVKFKTTNITGNNARCFSLQKGEMIKDKEISVESAQKIDICLHFGTKISISGAKHNDVQPQIPSNNTLFFSQTNKNRADFIKIFRKKDIEKSQTFTDTEIFLNPQELPQYLCFSDNENKRGVILIKKLSKKECVMDIKVEKSDK